MITNTSSERSVWNSVLRNKAPSTGSSPRKGKALMLVVVLFLISPPIAKLWPSISCTVVSALREVNEGSTALMPPPEIVTPVAFSSDTSGRTRRLMRPPPSTVGVNFTDTPNSFSSSVMVTTPLVPLASTFTRPSVFCMLAVTFVTPRPGTLPKVVT